MRQFRTNLFNYIQAIVGAIIGALAIVVFLSPFEIAPSGVTGIAVVLESLFNWPLGWMILIFNIPIVIWGAYTLRVAGARYWIRFSLWLSIPLLSKFLAML